MDSAQWNGHLLLVGRDHRWVRAFARGDLVRLRPGCYFPAESWHAISPWDRYGLCAAALVSEFPRTVFCLETALFLHQLPTLGVPSEIHILASSSGRIGRTESTVSIGRPGCVPRAPGFPVRRHGPSPGMEVESVGRFRTLLADASALRIAATRDVRAGVVALDGVIRASADGATMAFRLREGIGDLPTMAARRRARDALELADGRSESAGESLSRVGMRLLGYAPPELQPLFEVGTRSYRGDFYWPGSALLGEFDGSAKYRDVALREGRTELDVRRAEKVREEELKRRGLRVFRWNWSEALHLPTFDRILSGNGVPRAGAA